MIDRSLSVDDFSFRDIAPLATVVMSNQKNKTQIVERR